MTPDLVAAYELMDPETIGRRLRDARLAAGLKQPDVANGDMSVAYLSRVERGQRRPSVRVVVSICSRLGITVESLVQGFLGADLQRVEWELDLAELEVATGDSARAIERLAAVLETAVGDRLDLHERAHLAQARALAHQGDLGRALVVYEELANAVKPSVTWLKAVASCSRLLRETGNLRRSQEVAESALERVRPSPLATHEEVTRLTMTLAATLYESGDVIRAIGLCRQAVVQAESMEAPGARAAVYWNTAIMEAEAGNLTDALDMSRRALVLLEGEEDARMLARLRTQLGELLLQQEPPEIADALTQLSQAQAAYLANDSDIADKLRNRVVMGRAYFALGDLARAEQELTIAVTDGDGLPMICASASTILGQIAFASGAVERAQDHYRTSAMHLTAVGADREAAQQWYSLGLLLDEVGLDGDAKDAFRRAAASTGLSHVQVQGRVAGAHADPTAS